MWWSSETNLFPKHLTSTIQDSGPPQRNLHLHPTQSSFHQSYLALIQLCCLALKTMAPLESLSPTLSGLPTSCLSLFLLILRQFLWKESLLLSYPFLAIIVKFSGSIDWDPRNMLGGKEVINGWKPGSVSQVRKDKRLLTWWGKCWGRC